MTAPTTATKSGRVAVDGVDYYYEVHGTGQPLLLLHGGLMSGGMFAPLLPTLTKNHQVILVDLQGHGRTTLGTRPVTLEGGGNDMVAILDHLKIKQADVLGYSFGGGIAFQLAVQHPERVRKLVIASAGFSRDGFYAEMLPQQAAVGAALAPMMKDTPMYQTYAAIAPNVADFPKLLDRMGELMRKPYDYSAEAKKLTVPTLLMFGDSDMITLEHAVAFYKLLGGGQRDAGWQREHMAKNRFAIIPDATHYDIFDGDKVSGVVLPFLASKPEQVSAR